MFKKAFCLFVAALIMLALVGCDEKKDASNPTPTLSPGGTQDPTQPAFGGSGGKNNKPPEQAPSAPPAPTPRNQPFPAIYELSGTAEGEFDIGAEHGLPGFMAKYTFECQFTCLDAFYPSGRYNGSVYVSAKVDATKAYAELFKNIPKDVMVEAHFDAEGYGLRTGVTANMEGYSNYINRGQIWPITRDKDGNKVEPNNDQYVIEATNVEINFKSKGKAGASFDTGSSWAKVGDFDLSGTEVGDIGYRFIVEPDSAEPDFFNTREGTRKVRIIVSLIGKNGKVFVIEGEGTLKRMPGGLENQAEYDPPPPLSEKHDVEDTLSYSGGPEPNDPVFDD